MRKSGVIILIAAVMLYACSSSVEQSAMNELTGGTVVIDEVDELLSQAEATEEADVEPAASCSVYKQQQKDLDSLTAELSDKKKEMANKLDALETTESDTQKQELTSEIDSLTEEMNQLKQQIRLVQRQVDAMGEKC